MMNNEHLLRSPNLVPQRIQLTIPDLINILLGLQQIKNPTIAIENRMTELQDHISKALSSLQSN